MPPKLILKKDRERSLRNRHPWIFSGAIESFAECENGAVCDVYSKSGEWLAIAYVNRNSSIMARVLSFSEKDPAKAVARKIRSASDFRRVLFRDGRTTGFRLINGEGDGLPGLVVDKYGDVLVLQSGTLGIDMLKSLIVEQLVAIEEPRAIFEKSSLPTRAEEGLKPVEAPLFGDAPRAVSFKENDLRFEFDPTSAQKTGFFLDQREMRAFVGAHAKNRVLLNCFSYSGAFSVYAARGGADIIDSVDSSAKAMDTAKSNMAINSLEGAFNYVVEDAFDYLRAMPSNHYDFVILDPPAFAKHKKDIAQGAKGYNEINRVALQKIKHGGTLVTCSCSHFVDDELFKKILFSAARDAGREVRIIGGHLQAADHPVSIFHPEGRYLKSLILQVE